MLLGPGMRTQTTSYFARLFAGDLSAFGGPATDEAVAGHIRAEQMSLVLGYSVGIMLANACNAAVLAIALWHSPDWTFALIWAVVVAAAAIAFGLQSHASRRITKPQFVSRRAMHRLVATPSCSVLPGASCRSRSLRTPRPAASSSSPASAPECWPAARWPSPPSRSRPLRSRAPIFIGIAICLGRDGDPAYVLMAVLVLVYGQRAAARRVRQFICVRAARDPADRSRAHRSGRIPLTHLPNRVAFNETLDGALKRLALSGEEFAVLLLDLDRFKEVNDRFGHPAGDEFLVQVASRLQRCTRAAEHVARIGGDEFALVMANLARPEDALEIAERFVAAFSEPFLIEGCEIVGATSVGIVLAPRDGNTPLDIMKNADAALYRAKKAGPGTVCFFEEADDKASRDRKALQRISQAPSPATSCFWCSSRSSISAITASPVSKRCCAGSIPQRGLVPPSEFIPIAEETGLIHEIGEWVIRRACATCRLAGRHPGRREFLGGAVSQCGLLQTIVQALADAKVAPHRLEIEITESMLLSKYGSAVSILNALLELGVDDGAG